MKRQDYDPASPQSILEYAKQLEGKSLSDVIDMSAVPENVKSKGDLGQLVEKYFFGYQPNNSPEPDFPQAGVELKTTGVIRHPSKGYKAKERLVLSMIDYLELAQEQWDSCSLMKKCRLLLILFYLYDKEVPVLHRRFVPSPVLFKFPDQDLQQIQLDWEFIRKKVASGQAHELSESDTFYLSACRKGSGGPSEKLRSQPNSEVGAKARAFSLKPKYVDLILSGKSVPPPILETAEREGIEEATRRKLRPFLGLSVEQLKDDLNVDVAGKGLYRNLVMAMLGTVSRTVPELDRADIELKTIRVGENWTPKESMSFPSFKYLEIINEVWEDSSFREKLERKFLFAIFREGSDGIVRFEKTFYWNMPYLDREEARRVWEDTKRRVMIDAEDLPKSSESRVAHVRPHAKNSLDRYPTPQNTEVVKKGFWLNRSYLRDVIRDL
jgi:DNA mismatch repair protein MutH